jgi:hypothetical protein
MLICFNIHDIMCYLFLNDNYVPYHSYLKLSCLVIEMFIEHFCMVSRQESQENEHRYGRLHKLYQLSSFFK